MSDQGLWARRVTEWKASGLPSTTFTEGRGYSASALRYWAKRLEREATPRAAAPAAPVRIARLVRDDVAPDPGGTITVEVGRVRLTVGRGFDRATLRDVLEVLAELGQGAVR
jgi:hypothetical protein